GDPDGPHRVELVRVGENLCFQRLWFYIRPVPVGPYRVDDAGQEVLVVLNGPKKEFRPACSLFFMRNSQIFLDGPGDIVEKGSGNENFHICLFVSSDNLAEADDPERMVQPVRALLSEYCRRVCVYALDL